MAKYKSLAEAVKDINIKKKVRIIANTTSHAFGLGVISVVMASISGTYVQITANVNGGAAYAYNIPLKDIESSVFSKVEIENEIISLNQQITGLKARLQYIAETGNEDFDETEFKVYGALQILETKKMNKIEKSKVIAQLINS